MSRKEGENLKFLLLQRDFTKKTSIIY